MDPFSSPYIIPNSSFHNPFPHSLLRTRQQFKLTEQGLLRLYRKAPASGGRRDFGGLRFGLRWGFVGLGFRGFSV